MLLKQQRKPEKCRDNCAQKFSTIKTEVKNVSDNYMSALRHMTDSCAQCGVKFIIVFNIEIFEVPAAASS